MSSERSTLLPSARQKSRNSSHATQRRVTNQNVPSAPDLLSDYNGESLRPMPHSNYGQRMDQDLIQIDDNLPPSVSSSSASIQKLQSRKQVRNQVLARSIGNSGVIEHAAIFDEDDSDDGIIDNRNTRSMFATRRARSPKNDEQLLYLEEEISPAAPVAQKSLLDQEISIDRVAQNLSLPLEALRNELLGMDTKEIMQKREIRSGSKHDNISNMFQNGKKPDPKFNLMSQQTMKQSTTPLSPPRPYHQPVKHAKRAVSTLFGSSIVVNHPSDQEHKVRHISLLDAVSRPLHGRANFSGGNAYPDGTGMEMQNTRTSRKITNTSMNRHEDGDDLIDFNEAIPRMRNDSTVNSTESRLPVRVEQYPQHNQPQDISQISIDIGDPFSFAPHNTASGMPVVKQRLRSNNTSKHVNASSLANSWFGNSTNYTAQTMKIPQPAKNPHGFMQEHHLLEKLHQEGADRSPDHQTFSSTGWNRLNLALFSSYAFTSAASSVPIALIPTIAMDVLSSYNEGGEDAQSVEAAASIFVSTVATYAVLGTAFGKFLNGPIGDICGARRVACIYASMLSISLMTLSFGYSSFGVIACCAAVEFFQSVQWPCIVVILAAHYGNRLSNEGEEYRKESPTSSENLHRSQDNSKNKAAGGSYERGVYIASLGSRCGSLSASLFTTMLLRYHHDSWRFVARLAAFSSFFGCAILFMFVTDSPYKLHHPQNPVKEQYGESSRRPPFQQRLGRRDVTTFTDIVESFKFYVRMMILIVTRNVLPSLRSVLSNGTFWVVAIAHSGGLMVCSSVRILGTYFRDTSYGTISENESGAVTMFLSVGILVGLALGGNAFANLSSNAQARKKMVSNLYIMTVTMCYALAFLALPFVRNAINSSTVVAFLQAMASFCMGAGVAVQVYCIPAIVGGTFGANKGLYASYTDGVACIVSSWVWSIVGNAVQEGNPQGGGWAYGWAAVALLVILAGILMVHFVEYYFCRGGWRGRLKDTISNSHHGPPDLNSSFAESSKRLWENRPAFFRSGSTFKRRDEMKSILSIADDDDDDASTIVFEDVTLPIDYGDIETDQSSPVDMKQQVLDLIELRGNDVCVDCKAPFPRWVSVLLPNRIALSHRGAAEPLSHQIGCFCCTECAGSHRKLGIHIAFVRSVDYDSFKRPELLALRRGGNTKVNAIYEALLKDSSAKPSSSASMEIRERFIVTKYEKKLWYNSSNTSTQQEASFDLDSTLASIELVPNHYVQGTTEMKATPRTENSPSAFEVASHFDRKTRAQYDAFVHSDNDSDSEFAPRRHRHHTIQVEDASISSEDSGDWHIEKTERRGLDRLVNL